MSTLLVFRNNLSHARYNEARMLVGLVKNGLRTSYQQYHTGVLDLIASLAMDTVDPRALASQAHSIEIMKLMEVRAWALAQELQLVLLLCRFCC